MVAVSSDSESASGPNKEADSMYFINMYVGEKFVRDPELRYDGGTVVRFLKDPDTMSYFELEKIVQNGLPEVDCAGLNLGAKGQYKIPEDVGVSLRAEGRFTDKRPDDEVVGARCGGARVSLESEIEKAINDELVQDEGEVETSIDDELVENKGEAVDDDNVYLVRVDGEGSDAEEDSVQKRRSQYPLYNSNVALPQFYIGMVFRDGKEFREGIRKHSLVSRKALKFVRNEPYRITGLENAIEAILPRVELRNYARHVFVNWEGTYKYALQPINGRHEWKRSALEPIQPPIKRKMPGKPKKVRKSKGESRTKARHISRVGNINTCSLCNKQGHNKRSYPDRGLYNKPYICNNTKKIKSKDKGKQPIEQCGGRAVRNKKPTIKGYRLHTNLKTRQQTFYGFSYNKGITIRGPSSDKPSRRDKRKAATKTVGNQESLKKKKK
ncbi:hypothetical protein PTKIN_Ptkin05aG0219100 [Pterospermum kingtungense]